MASEDPFPAAPSPSWRVSSSFVMGLTGMLSRTFLLMGNRLECRGLEPFLELLEERTDPYQRTKGLITVSNHLSILDDPLMWGALPYKYHWSPNTMRWGLGSQDLMFKQSLLCTFFSLGQCLPTHRLAHSPYGGLFQPTVTQAIRLLSSPPFGHLPTNTSSCQDYSISDPFTDATSPTYNSSPLDHYPYPAPSYYKSRRQAWVHIFPEGRIHQHPDRTMRYFKWGVSRLILESDPAPTLVPIYIEGFEHIMHESRGFPRFVPRVGKDVIITFGDRVETDEGVFDDLRQRWRKLVLDERARCENEEASSTRQASNSRLLLTERLKYSAEAVRLREECTIRVRDEVLRLRCSRGWADEDPKARLADTWREEGRMNEGRMNEGQMNDGSWIRDT